MQSSGISFPASISASKKVEARPRSRFALSGPSAPIDVRVQAARRDLADIRLADRVFAPHYAIPFAQSVTASGPIYDSRQCTGAAVSQILVGERFDLLEIVGDCCWGISEADGSVGYCSRSLLRSPVTNDWIVSALSAPVRSAPRRDADMIATLPMGSRVPQPGKDGWSSAAGGFLDAADLRAANELSGSDIADIAETLIGVPVVAGGRSGAGVDPAGLLFLSLAMCRMEAPRFLDIQAREVGTERSGDATPARGDMAFFHDHVVILIDTGRAIHADFDAGKVVIEPVADLVDGRFGDVECWRRLGE